MMSKALSPIRTVSLWLTYLVTQKAVSLVALTMITYVFVQHKSGIEKDGLQKIHDLVAANEILTIGTASILFTLALHILRPLTRTSWHHVWNFSQQSGVVIQSIFHGAVIGGVTLIALAVGRYVSYLGFYMRFDEIALSTLTIIVFSFAILATALIEEYIFRACIENFLERRFSLTTTVLLSTILYVSTKAILYDVTYLYAFNLGLLNIMLSVTARTRGTFVASALLYFGLFATMHFCFGLPFMGQDMPGLLLLRPETEAVHEGSLGEILSGGAWGPEGGLIFSILLIVALYLPHLRTKKIA